MGEAILNSGAAAAIPRPDRRQQIVAAAAAVLGRQGYSNTSLKQVAKEAGIAPGLLHYYFQSKEELLLEVVASIDRQLVEDWVVDLAGVDDPMSRINAGFDRALENVTNRPEFYRLMLDAYSLALDNPAIGERVAEMLDNYCDLIAREIGALPIIPGAAAASAQYDFAGAIAGAMNGIAFLSMVRGKSPEYAYNAFKLQLLGLAAGAFIAAGAELPPWLGEMMRDVAGRPRTAASTAPKP